MDILPSGNIFRELQDIHDTGYFSAQPSLEDHWQQVRMHLHLNSYHLARLLSSSSTPVSTFSFRQNGVISQTGTSSVLRRAYEEVQTAAVNFKREKALVTSTAIFEFLTVNVVTRDVVYRVH